LCPELARRASPRRRNSKLKLARFPACSPLPLRLYLLCRSAHSLHSFHSALGQLRKHSRAGCTLQRFGWCIVTGLWWLIVCRNKRLNGEVECRTATVLQQECRRHACPTGFRGWHRRHYSYHTSASQPAYDRDIGSSVRQPFRISAKFVVEYWSLRSRGRARQHAWARALPNERAVDTAATTAVKLIHRNRLTMEAWMLIVAGGRRVGDHPSILDNPKRRSRLSFRNQIEDRHESDVSDQTSEELKTFKPLSPSSPTSRRIWRNESGKFANARAHSPARESRALPRPGDLQVALAATELGRSSLTNQGCCLAASSTSFSAPPWERRPVVVSFETRCWLSPVAAPYAFDSL